VGEEYSENGGEDKHLQVIGKKGIGEEASKKTKT
jgi:hypothetical protein